VLAINKDLLLTAAPSNSTARAATVLREVHATDAVLGTLGLGLGTADCCFRRSWLAIRRGLGNQQDHIIRSIDFGMQ
jgi:hypothetical protein